MTLRSVWRTPLFWILVAAAALRLAGLFWGLPASDGWDDDGFAPRNFLTALALTYKPGAFFTYPPLHAFLLLLLTWPGVIFALLQAHSLAQADVVRAFTQAPIMTFFAVTARLVSLVMALGIILCAERMARLIAGRRAGLCAAVACALNAGLVYYGQVSNLDVPYIFWSMLALLAAMRAVAGEQPRYFWQAALFAAAATATKDQAYAVFALSLPVLLLLWFAADAWPRRHARAILTTVLAAAALALLALLLVDGALTNPHGFIKRLAFLAGPASQDYAAYAPGLAGRLALLHDMAGWYLQGPAAVVTALGVLGLVLHLRRRDSKSLWVAGLLPFFAIVSFTVCFNFAALRTDDRFLLPQAIFATVYIGIAAQRLIFAAQPWLRAAARAALALTALLALHQAIAIDAAFLFDPRYDAERWMASHLRPGDTVETYGQNCFLPRFPGNAVVTRIGKTPLATRNPLLRVTEIKMPFGAVLARNPRYILVSDIWARRYRDARPMSKIQRADFNDIDARRFFAALYNGGLGYRIAHVARYDARFWPAVHIHDSLDGTIHIFERAP